MAIPIAIGMAFQTLYYLVDVYFVGRIGEAAVAGLTSGGNAWFLVMALTQVLGVGTMALIANASGRKDRADAILIFNQSLGLAALLAAITLVGGYTLTDWCMEALAADAETVAEGSLYLRWCLPGLALQFALVSMGSALRGTGIVKPTIFVQVFSVGLNAILAPFMIAGWVTGRPLGVLGAGLSTTISIAVGVLMMLAYFLRLEGFVRFDFACVRPRPEAWGRILRVGLPPGGEFALMFVYMAVIYWCIRGFGAEAQAGFGIGSRVMQAVFLPAMAIAFATAPVAAAERPEVREITSRQSVLRLLVYGDVPERTLKELAYGIEEGLSSLPEVSLAEDQRRPPVRDLHRGAAATTPSPWPHSRRRRVRRAAEFAGTVRRQGIHGWRGDPRSYAGTELQPGGLRGHHRPHSV